jgi:primosomal replication protein N
VVEFSLDHESEQEEAGSKRAVKAELGAVAFETQARLLSQGNIGSRVRLQGFLGAKSQRSKRIVLHVTNIEFIEGA